MSKAPRQLPFLNGDFPPELVRYWQDDFRKNHLQEIQGSTGDVLVFDLTRDVLCGLFEIEDFSFVIDPMSVKGILWYGDHINEDHVRQALKTVKRRIYHGDKDYFEIWKAYFDDFAAVARKFETVVLNRLFFTNRIASEQSLTHGDANEANIANCFLEEAYDYVKSSYDFIKINYIPKKFLMTGTDVPWGGPSYTHIQNEATALFAENLRQMIHGPVHVPGNIFVDCAMDRVKKHEDLIRTHQSLQTDRDQLSSRLEAAEGEHHGLRAQLADAERQRHDLAIERDQLSDRLQTVEAEQHQLRASYADVERQRNHIAVERDQLSQRSEVIAGEHHGLRTQLADAERRRHEDAAERDQLSTRLRAAEAEHDHLLTNHADVERQRDDLAIERDQLSQRLEATAGEHHGLRTQLADGERHRHDTAIEWDQMLARLEAAVGEQQGLRAQLAAAERQREIAAERDELTKRLQTAVV